MSDLRARTIATLKDGSDPALCLLLDWLVADFEAQIADGHANDCDRCAMLEIEAARLNAELDRMAQIAVTPSVEPEPCNSSEEIKREADEADALEAQLIEEIGTAATVTKPDFSFECPTCRKQFSCEKNLRLHIAATHGRASATASFEPKETLPPIQDNRKLTIPELERVIRAAGEGRLPAVIAQQTGLPLGSVQNAYLDYQRWIERLMEAHSNGSKGQILRKFREEQEAKAAAA